MTPELAGRIAKLILLMGAENEDEATAALMGLRRTLAGADLNMHAVAELITGHTNESRSRIERIIEFVDWDTLKAHERSFVNNMSMRLDANPDFYPSPKQINWLTDLASRRANGR